MFLEIKSNLQIFGNVWSLNGSLIFRGSPHVFRSLGSLSDVFTDYSGVLEEEQLVRGPNTHNLWHCEQPVLYQDSKTSPRPNNSCLRPIATTPPADSSWEKTFQDWTVLTHPASHSINIHIYGPGRSPQSTLVCFNTSSHSGTALKLPCRTYPHLRHPSDLATPCFTRI